MDHWFLIRGLVREAAHWGEFSNLFAAAFPEAHLHYLDIPGNGRHHLEPTPLSVPAMMESMRAEAHAMAPQAGRRFLFALSLGGMVSLCWAQRHPDELAGIVLANTSFGGFSPFYRRLRPAALVPILRSAAARDPVDRERGLLAITSNRDALHAETAFAWAEIRRQRPVQARNALRQMVAAARYRPSAAKPAVPQLVLCGLGDRLVDPACSLAIHEAWNAPYQAHPTAGHDLTLDAGPWVIEQIRSWKKALR